MNSKVVLILGAGCSVNCGYPLALQMRDSLNSFVESLDDQKAEKFKKLGREVLSMMDAVQAGTLDELARLVMDKKADSFLKITNETLYGQRYLFNYRAKALTRAYFLSLEKNAANKGLPGYSSLAFEIRNDAGEEDLTEALKSTRYRIISFNYDCCFEMACMNKWPVQQDENLYRSDLLNMGIPLRWGTQNKWVADRFTYLKAHGSIKLIARHDRYEETQFAHSYNPLTPWDGLIEDRYLYWRDSNPPELVDGAIFFPCERIRLTGTGTHMGPAREYARELPARLNQTCKDASIIRFVGYSAAVQDVPYLQQILSDVIDCKRWEVYNLKPALDGIKYRLIHSLGIPEDRIYLTDADFQ